MSEQPTPQQKEIDLIDVTGKLFSGIGEGILNLFGWLKHTIQAFFRLAFKFWLVLLFATILGGAFGFFKAKLQKPYFETEMLADTSIVSRIQIADRINSLQTMIRDGNNTILAQRLSLLPNQVEGVFFIKADFIDVKVEGNPTRTVVKTDKDGVHTEEILPEVNPQFVRIRVRTRENKKIEQLAPAIVHFIENDPFINEVTTLARQHNIRMQEAIEFEIQQLVLFQKKNIEKQVFTQSVSSPLMVVNEERTYTNEILELRSRLSSLRQDYELLRPIRVVQPFTPFENPVDKRLINTLFFALLFFAAGYGGLLFREGWKRV